jgi:hypothetical protein
MEEENHADGTSAIRRAVKFKMPTPTLERTLNNRRAECVTALQSLHLQSLQGVTA